MADDRFNFADGKHNLIIRPDGGKAWKDKLHQYEPKGTFDRKTKSETNYGATEQVDKRDEARLSPMQWKLPSNFCPDCGRNDITPEQARAGSLGAFSFDEPRPELEMRPGDCLIFTQCGDCKTQQLWRDEPRLVYIGQSHRDLYKTHQQRMQDNVVAYIKMLKLRGEKPLAL